MVKNIVKKSIAFCLCFSICMFLMLGFTINSKHLMKTYAASNEEIIYNFLKNELGLNTAAACGVLANIEKESNFRPNLLEGGYTWASGGGYGICQWTNTPRTSSSGRRTNLVNFCNSRGYDYTSLTGQLYFLKYELETNVKPGVYSYLKGVPNTAQGAYDAGYKWCYSFEVPYNYKTGGSETRGNYARNKYWPKYSGTPDPEPIVVPSGNKFPACDSSYSSIVEALKSIAVDSSYSYRAKIAAANGISGYSGTAAQNTQMLNKLKSGTLIAPGDDPVPDPPPVVSYTETYFPACNSSYSSIVDALKSIGVDSSYNNRATIAAKNGITGYSGTAAQNNQLLSLLKSGKLINPNGSTPTTDTSGKYYPACSSSYSSIVDALKSVGVDSSYNNRAAIAAKNGISGYSGSSSQNTQMLNLLKSGKLIKTSWVEPPVIVNYSVSLNANGGSSPITSMTVASNSKYNGLPTPTREGYSFTGWYTTESGGSKVTDGSNLASSSNHTLYAHWNANTYELTLVKNDGSGSTTTKNITFGCTYGDLGTLSRAGYAFLGWYTDVNGGTAIKSDSKFSKADNQTLYAIWKANTYTVSFDLNGGTGSVSSRSVEYDGVYGTIQSPSKTGYTFNGWYTAKDGGTQISAESRVNITSNQTLYAHWTANKYKVTFDANGGNVAITSKDITYASTYGMLPIPERDGYTFKGWFTAKTNGTEISDSTTVNISSAQTLYAQWTENFKIEDSAITLKNGEQYTIKSNQGDVTFKSNNTNIAVVSKNGVVTALKEGSAIISVINSDSDVVQLKVKVIPAEVIGDCNNDGELSVADAVMLQSWILGKSKELTNWKAADLCEDSIIDVFDMVKMRQLLIENSKV